MQSTSLLQKKTPEIAPTPMMAQYLEIKAQYPDCLLFYRMGDFYELFYEDAVQAAAALGITLTRRGKTEGQDIPMCGVPVHAYEGYLARLIKAGFRVAVGEQVDGPQTTARGGKGLMRREVVRVVTPGTLCEDTLLDGKSHNFLAVLCGARAQYSLAALDMSTGDFFVESLERKNIPAALERLNPSELVIPDALFEQSDLYETLDDWKRILRPQPTSRFNAHSARRCLQEAYGLQDLQSWGNLSENDILAASSLVEYLRLTQKGAMPRLESPRRIVSETLLAIDAPTQRNLELRQTLSGAYHGSVLWVIDRTLTHAGARLLGMQLCAPLQDVGAIQSRLNHTAFYVEHTPARAALREMFKRCPDIERALSRLTLGRGGPRDLIAIREGLRETIQMRQYISGLAQQGNLPEALHRCMMELGFHSPLVERLSRAVGMDVPLQARDGGFIAPGYLPELDELRSLRDQSTQLTQNLAQRYAQETGITTLKIRFNNVLGYFIEITPQHSAKVPLAFIHRQTLANAMRYTTPELAELAERIHTAAEKALEIELRLFQSLVQDMTQCSDEIAKTARTVAQLDVATALAELAVENDFCKPHVDDSLAFTIRGGRHPVVAHFLRQKSAQAFVPNNCALQDAERLQLLTGPNMAGKSTYLRQNALIAILAQMGSFVPAAAAHIGVVDRLFSRVGAADDLAQGRSTFMVEMVETAAILNQATPRSLVILDEVGRGTSTHDGLSIAWACVEHLHNHNQSRCLFATHYHELVSLEQDLANVACYTMKIKQWEDKVIFMHEIMPGASGQSYGLHVAALAGLPAAVVTRARGILNTLEGSASASLNVPLMVCDADTPEAYQAAPLPRAQSDVLAALQTAPVDDLSPREAHALLYALRAQLCGNGAS